MTGPDLTIHHIRFMLEADTLLHFGPQAGAQLRGALWESLRTFACTDPGARHDPVHLASCPMCRLMAYEDAKAARGISPARPFAIQPPLGDHPGTDRRYTPRERFTVGVNLFGDAVDAFPFVVQAFQRMGQKGVGYGRGRFLLRGVETVDPLSDATEVLLAPDDTVSLPTLAITADRVAQAAAALSTDSVTLHFLTPTQIKQRGKMQTKPHFAPLIARLVERIQSLEYHYTESPTPQPAWKEHYLTLTAQAERVHLAEDNTEWVRVETGSRRTGQMNTLGGFAGTAHYQGDLEPFLPWLLWGQSLHVGKNAVKGNGWYRLA